MDKSLKIQINGINKSYGKQDILSDFSYSFENTGFYLLLGESGCGKTTLLNILSGMTDFYGGTIAFGKEVFAENVPWERVREQIGYVTQDSVFIDYLTVGEQLQLSGVDRDGIIRLMSNFGLADKYSSYPDELSGGERQRLAVIGALLYGKSILLLDEPTASLDGENKLSVFEMLRSVSENILVICASHDECAPEYADYVLSLDGRKIKEARREEKPSEEICFDMPTGDKRPVRLFGYFSKWFVGRKRDKHSAVYMMIIYMLTFLSLFAGDIPSQKLNKSLEHIYKINQCTAVTSAEDNTLEQMLYDFGESCCDTLSYNGSAPELTKAGDMYCDDAAMFKVLPFDKDFFALSDKLLYGNWFTDTYQVILGQSKAREYVGDDISSVIGQSVDFIMYDGLREFEVVGIFDDFSKTELQYLNSCGIVNPENGIFLNGNYTKTLADDPDFNWLEKRVHVVYFESYSYAKRFFELYSENESITLTCGDIESSVKKDITYLSYGGVAISFAVVLFSLLFCFQNKSLELVYNRHIFAYYDYLGFEKRKVRGCWILGNAAENLVLCVPSFAVSGIAAAVCNCINEHFYFLPYRIFTFNVFLVLSYFVLCMLFCVLMSNVSFGKIKTVSWKELFLQQRDLW